MDLSRECFRQRGYLAFSGMGTETSVAGEVAARDRMVGMEGKESCWGREGAGTRIHRVLLARLRA